MTVNAPLPRDTTAPVVPGPSAYPRRRGVGAGAVLTLVDGVLAGVSGVFVTTHSVQVTVIATVAAVVLAVTVLVFKR